MRARVGKFRSYEIETIRRWRAEGMPAAQIAGHLGVSLTTIYEVLAGTGAYAGPLDRRDEWDRDVKAAIEMRVNGVSRLEISERLGRHMKWVWQNLAVFEPYIARERGEA